MNNYIPGAEARKKDTALTIEEAERRDMAFIEKYCEDLCFESNEIAHITAMLNYIYQQTHSPIVQETISNIQTNFRARKYGIMPPPAPPSSPRQQTPSDTQEEAPSLNFDAPLINIQRMLSAVWYQLVCTDNNRFNQQWTNEFAAALMASEHGEYIARKWAMKAQPQQIRAHVLGTLLAAKVLKGKALQVSRYYLGISDRSASEVQIRTSKTFAKYMGSGEKEPYAQWVSDYVSNS